MQYIKAETETYIAGPMKAITLAVNQRVLLNLQVQKLTESGTLLGLVNLQMVTVTQWK